MGPLFEYIQLRYFTLSALLFLIGLYLGPLVVEKNWRPLLVYPRWMMSLMEKYLNRDWGFFTLAVVIFLLNNVSLFTSLLSGFALVIPPLAALLTGIHLSVISFQMMGWRGMWEMLINPVAWLEFPAAWISFAGAFQISESIWRADWQWSAGVNMFHRLVPVYLKYVGGLLLLAAVVESGLIVLARRAADDSDDDAP